MKKVLVRQEKVTIPTYPISAYDKNPMFLEKRVYQGSSGKVYPLPVIDKIEDEKKEMPYQAVYLENDYLRITVLPELGGRIQRAYDKTPRPVTPTAASVLYSLLADASADGESFSDWCTNYGYDTDSRKALATYEACCMIRADVNKFFTTAERAELAAILEDY